ncbi:outer membrane protein transport protein [Otariodibacter sp.]|uniref:porin n=1 Tax=Otariodibacter sp. TaxID=3030919 RepID=UPI00261459D1|nr:outer membrane protein transport protein [Otariodibacter sp.]
MTKFTQTAIASLVSIFTGSASAAAFQLAEISSSGLGLAFAGNAAVADNASVVASNPALMTKFKNIEVSAGSILVDSDVHINGKFASSSAKANQENIVPNVVVPNAYIVMPVNDRFSIGGGININYGLKSEYASDYNAGFFGGRTDLSAINLNLSGAYNLGYGFSIGVGLDVVKAKAELERNLGLIGKAAALQAKQKAQQAGMAAQQAGATAQEYLSAGRIQEAQVAMAQANQFMAQANQAAIAAQRYATMENETIIHRLTGDKWALGWNVGLLYEFNEKNRIGFAYHSPIKVKFKGQYSNTLLMPIPTIVEIDNITGGVTIPGALTLKLPSFWEISGYHKLTDKLAVQYSYKRTNWSTFKSLEATSLQTGNILFHKTENFNDASRIAIGLSYDFTEKLTVRTGIAYDETASISNPSISIPDTDRTWYSIGATYRFTPNMSIDLGYSYIKGSKNNFNEDGLVNFKTAAKANLYGLNINYKF